MHPPKKKIKCVLHNWSPWRRIQNGAGTETRICEDCHITETRQSKIKYDAVYLATMEASKELETLRETLEKKDETITQTWVQRYIWCHWRILY